MLVDQRRENVEHHRAMDENETPPHPPMYEGEFWEKLRGLRLQPTDVIRVSHRLRRRHVFHVVEKFIEKFHQSLVLKSKVDAVLGI